jgi:dihydroxy-acid dehydratase
VGGPLGLVRDGDRIRLDVPGRRVDLLVDEEELHKRADTWRPPETPERGWRRLYAQTVLPANLGADLDFLSGEEPRGQG